jgi:hypothetical protein
MVVASRRSRWQSKHVRQRASRSRLTMTELALGAAAGDEEGEARRALFLLLPSLLGSSAPSTSSSCTGGGGGSSLTLGSAASAGGESGTGSVGSASGGGGGRWAPAAWRMGLVGSRCGVGKARRRGRGREEVGGDNNGKSGQANPIERGWGLDAKAKAKAWLIVFVPALPHTLPSELDELRYCLSLQLREFDLLSAVRSGSKGSDLISAIVLYILSDLNRTIQSKRIRSIATVFSLSVFTLCICEGNHK